MKPEQLELIRDMAARGEKKSKIARAVGLHRNTIANILKQHDEAA